MLELKNITKDYLSGDMKVKALKGIDLEFRKSEFVSILGQSGCGKTTLLNIIGGLDRYTSGDLIINGKSTKQFKDKDWDAYRNYSVGFVFQNYNLIPHQTVLSNVELALTLSGVSKKERRQKAITALEKVGLKDQIHKKPNQMSGGQMQRVAIARALVNDPDIILADEPTGALDTETSVQIMNILKEISQDKLIIMVTHNPELAEKYSSRIVKILDGKIMDDSNPYTEEDRKNETRQAKSGKTSMNYFTALSLSLNNLMTKKGRTFLTAFAGSIGIIGIALILSLSNGVQKYIQKVQEDTLSSYPISIQEESIDMGSMMTSMMEEENNQVDHSNDGKVYSRNIMGNMLSTLSTKMKTNNLEEFKKYIENDNTVIKENSNAIQYKYDLNLNMYKADTANGIVQVNPSTVMSSIGFSSSTENEEKSNTSMFSMSFGTTDVWRELLDNKDLMNSQYDVIAGKMPEKYNEVVLIVDENNEISDYTLYSLGLRDQSELKVTMNSLQKGIEVAKKEIAEYTYDELLNLSYKLLLNTDYYQKANGIWVDKSGDEQFMKNKLEEAESIKVVGIIKPKKESNIQDTAGEIGYTKELTEYVINKVNESEIVKQQKENSDVNIFTGMKFKGEDEISILSSNFDYNSLSAEQKAYMQNLSQEELANIMANYTKNNDATYESVLKKLGAVDLNKPSVINIYPKDFAAKDVIADEIELYNNKQRDAGKEENVIEYSDMVGMMMTSVTVIVNMISYVLIAFVSISLIVSSIMIGIITYISVLERTKEIGILRAIGASKKDISRVFNAETLIVGLAAGLIGIGVTLLLNIPINAIIKALTGVSGIASLPLAGGIVLVLISIILTVIAGLIPSKVASKKDPVEALRTE
ncbi:MAG: ABC transporter ATP-binding protein/permease [Clostridia bacterium]|nr:ABC transporter ATP-binding protein/permease [Clostridia bacterium]